MKNLKPSILYVDDEQYNLNVFVAAFRRYYTIYTAISAIDAMSILQQHKVDLIITDQRMPDMTGVQFLETIIPEYPDPVRMILTGFSDIEAIIKAINQGSVLRYITKPWDEEQLKELIDLGIKIHAIEQSNKLLLQNLEQTIAKQKKTIELFEKYVPKEIFTKILDSNFETPVFNDTESKIISVLFCDIRQFTKFSENRTPQTIVRYLNKYFSIMVECVTKNQGIVYNFMGDGLIALFGVSSSSEHDHRLNAVNCAISMLEALKKFNQDFGKEIDHESEIGIGISTGEGLVWHIVTEKFLSYAITGDVLDNAIKLEGLTKDRKNIALISEPTYNAVKNDIQATELKLENTGENTEKLYLIVPEGPDK